jgi:hypothetical protein
LGYLAAVTHMCAGDAGLAGQKNQLIIGRFAAVCGSKVGGDLACAAGAEEGGGKQERECVYV